MKILLVEPERIPEVKEISGTLESMQETVGGIIQAIYPFEEPVALVCHEEGKLIGVPMNRSLSEIGDIIFGTFFLCGTPPDSETFTSLTDEQIERYQKRFQFPDLFLPVEDGVVFILTEDL